MLTWLLQLTGRLRAFFRPGDFDRDFDQELESHLDMLAEDYRRRGLAPEQARRAAHLELGALGQLREAHREVRGMPLLSACLQDLRGALRTLRKTPGFTMTALAVLALGIGTNTAIFSVVNAIFLKPIPFPDPDRLVVLMNTLPRGEFAGASPAKFQYWRSQSDVLEDVSTALNGVINYTGDEVAEQLRSAQVSAAFFRCFGIPIVRGRSFTPEEELPNGPRVVVISDAFWMRQFAQDPRLIGQTISLNGDQYKVIGIRGKSPDLREFGLAADAFLPFPLDPNTSDQGNYFTVVARLRHGVTLDQAKARLQQSAAEYRAKFPGALPPNGGFTVMPFREVLIGNVGSSLLVLAGAVGFVLLIACANVANLQLVRATERRREIGIRIAIGAGRARIVRQLLTESVLLSLAGGALGLLLGFVGIRALLAVNTAGLPRVGQDGAAVDVDWRVLSFTILISVVTGIVFGLIPALQGSRADVNGVLKDSAGRSGTAFRQSRALSLLVVGEISLAVILSLGSALLIRTSMALSAVDPGFDPKNVLTLRMALTGPAFLTSAGVERMVRDGVDRLHALPGVVATSATCCVPLEGEFAQRFTIAGRPPSILPMSGAWVPISPGFFNVYKIPLKRGRTFNDRDDAKSPPVVVISETLANEFWRGDDPLKDRIVIGRGVMKEFQHEPERQIIGVVGDVRSSGLANAPAPTMYIPQGQLPDAESALTLSLTPLTWIVRTQGEPHALAPAVQEQLRQSSGLPVSNIQSMDEILSSSMARPRFNTLLMTVFGVAALVLAAIGIYGLMAYSVEQRTLEIGIRLTLGAGMDSVRSAVVFQGMRLALAGVAVGVASAFGMARFIAGFLFGVHPRDPIVFVVVPLVLSVVALCAVWCPASRASRIDPAEALRSE